MNEIITFFKDIFMLSDETSKSKIGLLQLKDTESPVKAVKKEEKQSKDVKLSDLMKRSA